MLNNFNDFQFQKQLCQIWPPKWVRLATNDVPYLSHLGPIWSNLDGKFDKTDVMSYY